MILGVHAIAGAAISKFADNSFEAFILGFFSHFILDAIPHWHYELRSQVKSNNVMEQDMIIGRKFVRDLLVGSSEVFLGVAISFLFFDKGWGSLFNPSPLIFWGIVGGVIPDPLQLAFWKLRREPLTSLQRFHEWIHAKNNLDHLKILGPLFQIIISFVIILLFKFLAP